MPSVFSVGEGGIHPDSQLVMNRFTTLPISKFVFLDPLAIPLYTSIASTFTLALHLLFNGSSAETSELDSPPRAPPVSSSDKLMRHIEEQGGGVIFANKTARLLGCLTLLGLSATSWVTIPITNSPSHVNAGIFGASSLGVPPTRAELNLAMCLACVYASILCILSMIIKPRWSTVVGRHVNSLLIITLGVFVYRDVYPLATYTKTPMDGEEGWIIRTKIAILVFVGLVLPLIVPRRHVAVNSKGPIEALHPEQTVSLLSLFTYSYLDPFIMIGLRGPELSYDQLPSIAHYDTAECIREKWFSGMNEKKDRHILWDLLYFFRHAYVVQAISIVIRAATSFISPIAMRELLRYLETNGDGAIIRPWFWIMCLFIGPMAVTISFQWYTYSSSHNRVQIECIITQLMFEHSLRVQTKSEPSDSASDLPPSSNDTGVVNPSSGRSREAGNETNLNRSQGTSMGEPGKVKPLPNSIGSKPGVPSSQSTTGRINNLVSTDLGNIVEAADLLLLFIYVPLQIILCIVFLYFVLGWSAFVGLGVIALLTPAPGYMAKYIGNVQTSRLKRTDARVQAVVETMNILRMVKMFGWEKKMNAKVAETRDDELYWVWRRQVLELFLNSTSNDGRNLLYFTILMGKSLNASIVFSSIAVFDMLREQLRMASTTIGLLATGKASLDRVDDFLRNAELLDHFSKKDIANMIMSNSANPIGFEDVHFSWSNQLDSSRPLERKFVLRIDGKVTFVGGQINLIVGPTGSGKTSLLMALLGEMHFLPRTTTSWYNLPREAGVSYAAQESWVQNATIKENITFGAPFNETRYKKVLYQCCLEYDLELFAQGDETEVGERGLTLSGGQKARVTLARAIYSEAEIILLDDIMAALDAHTAQWIIDKCLKGDLVKGRTVLLVTHNISMTLPIAAYIVSMGLDGRIEKHGLILETLLEGDLIAKELVPSQEGKEVSATITTESSTNKKLILTEEIAKGHVRWKALKLYFLGLGGHRPFLFFSACLGSFIITELLNTAQTWYLGYWGSQYERLPPSDVDATYYLGVYISILLAAVISFCFSRLVYILGTLRASRNIHWQLFESILGTTFRWLDTTPTSRVVARCTNDIRAVDGPIPTRLWQISSKTIMLLTKFGAIVFLTPSFLVPSSLVAILGGLCGQAYMVAQLPVKREMSNSKAPILAHFEVAIGGLVSLRAFNAQTSFEKVLQGRINRYTRTARVFYDLNRWIIVRIGFLGALFPASLAAYLVYAQSDSALNTGFSLNMASGFSIFLLWWIRDVNDFEVQANSLERIQQYLEIEQEPKSTSSGIPRASWPTSGEIRVENLSARYSIDSPNVLHGVSFQINSGEHIGIVGRTGSGKSSLALAFLRCILTEGSIYYDGIDTRLLSLDTLRSNITIIPQMPELLSGTLRQNIDPFGQHTDASLNDALRAAGLDSLQNNSSHELGKITLDSRISAAGSNLSVGQRQIIALARAIVQRNKLIIMDEATSAIDNETDTLIQSSFRNNLGGGNSTLITIAHRLRTIMEADRIIVIEAGRIVEFDSPRALLQVQHGKFRALVESSG